MKLRLEIALGIAVVGAVGAWLLLRSRPDMQKAAEAARRTLRQAGFKTELSDFNFPTTQESMYRAAALTNVQNSRPVVLLQPASPDCAVVAWQQPGLEDPPGYPAIKVA